MSNKIVDKIDSGFCHLISNYFQIIHYRISERIIAYFLLFLLNRLDTKLPIIGHISLFRHQIAYMIDIITYYDHKYTYSTKILHILFMY